MTRSERLDAVGAARLYGIVDLGYTAPADVAERASQLIAGGAGIIQLRAKGFSEGDILSLARLVQPVCAVSRVPFVVNDFANIAVEVGADGLHIGQDDGDYATARSLVGEEILIGRSTHSVQQARQAMADGFDHGGFGPLFPTPTKQGRPGIGLESIAEVERDVAPAMPLFCIGGITPDNLDQVIAAGAKRVVVVSQLLLAEDVEAAASSVVRRIKASL